MTEYFDDFDDDYGEFEDDGFMEDDFEDTYGEHLDDCEPDESMDDELGPEIDREPLLENEPIPDEFECDKFTGRDAFILGGAMGWAYEEGLEEGRRKRRKQRKNSDSNDPQDID